MKDPTRKEMLEVCRKNMIASDDDFEWASEAAIYWFAADYHNGQASNLYSVLSTSKYDPGPIAKDIDDEDPDAQRLYHSLRKEFAEEE